MTTILLFNVVMSAFIYQGQGYGNGNFALLKSANQSTTLTANGFSWTANKAVDGNSDGNHPYTSRTCSATAWTTSNENHIWEVDIGFQIIVKTITVYGRTDAERNQLDGVRLYLGNTSGPWNYGQAFSSDKLSDTPLIQYVFKPDNVIARFISLMRAGYIMTICEVTVEGSYGNGNFVLLKSANQSSTLTYNDFKWTADKAVDGISDGGNPDTSRTCSATAWTTSYQNHIWEVDIGVQIIVKTIIVYGRTDSGWNQLNGVKLYLGNTSGPWSYSHEFMSDAQSSTQNAKYVFKPGNVIARFISLMRNGNILTICEVTVEGECRRGTYGPGCIAICGNCYRGNNSCSLTDGMCMEGCDAGWFGDICKNECRRGTYGPGCNEICGNCYKGNNSCSLTDGMCMEGCDAGWFGDICKNKCRYGTYGPGCNEICGYCYRGNNSCSLIDGMCMEGCDAGWFGDICKNTCISGTYGSGCNETCGNCYTGNSSCMLTDGRCTEGCAIGWRGDICKLKCRRGTYGPGCNEMCGNCYKGNNSCSLTDGMCMEGCDAGWFGDICKNKCRRGTYGPGCNDICGNCYKGNNSCSLTDGMCMEGCDAGWFGDTCKHTCISGTYGSGCNETCGNCYNGNISCLLTDGRCIEGCAIGWRGDTCKIKCEAGTYGFHCNETCGYCLNGKNNCSEINGQCNGGCRAGWTGETCKSGTLGTVTTVDAGPNTGAIIGSVLAAVAVSIFAMVIIIVIVKNRRKKHNNETSTDNVTTAAHYVNMVVGNPDAVRKITARSITEKDTTVSAIEEASLQRGMPIGATNNHSRVMEPNVPVHNVYEKLQDVTESIESVYYTIDHNRIGYADDQKMESMEPSSTYVETLQSLERVLKSVEEEISVLFDKKEQLLSKELETARGNKLQDKWKKKDSDKDKDNTIVNFVQALQSIEGELRILEEKRKCLLGRKEILLRQELAKTTENEK